MEVRDYLRIARRRWLFILGCLVVAVGVAALLTFRTTPQYASSARLFISTPGSDSSQAYQGSLFSQQRVTSYADLVTGRQVAEQVLQEVDSELTPGELSAKVSATVIPETVILEISVSDPRPEQAQIFAQAFAKQMTTFITDLEQPTHGGRSPIKATIAESASLPTIPFSPQPIRNLGLAGVLGLLLGVGIAVLRELLDTTLKSPADVTTVTEIPVMANIALDAEAGKKPLLTDISSHAPRAEAFRVLRTNMQFVDVDNRPRVFAVTSALPGEGKTSIATNLAMALAHAGHRTLLIDGDLRRPKIGTTMGLEHAVGLTTVLVGKVKVADAIQKHAASGLDVLTSGSVPPNPAELLQSHAMGDLLRALREEYDTIMVDSPPLLPVTDAALLSAQSDGALVVVRYGRTTKDQLANSVERLHAVEARPVGIVVNMVPTRQMSDSGYGYGYGYAPQEDAAITARPKRARRS